MSYPLPDGARAWQAKLRAFADVEPMRWEVEMSGGALPADAPPRRSIG